MKTDHLYHDDPQCCILAALNLTLIVTMFCLAGWYFCAGYATFGAVVCVGKAIGGLVS